MNRVRTGWVVAVGLLVALVLAGIISYYASDAPDGLNKVATDKGLDSSATSHKVDSPLDGYETKGVSNKRLSGGLAGVIGSVLVLGLATGLVLVVRRKKVDDELDPAREETTV